MASDAEDVAALRRAVRQRAARIQRRELRRALRRMEHEASLTAEQRAIVAQLAASIVDGVFEEHERAAEGADEDAARTALELFAGDGPDESDASGRCGEESDDEFAGDQSPAADDGAISSSRR